MASTILPFKVNLRVEVKSILEKRKYFSFFDEEVKNRQFDVFDNLQ